MAQVAPGQGPVPVDQLSFNKTPTIPPMPPDITIYDNHSTEYNKYYLFMYYLMGLDKLHDFGDVYSNIYTLIQKNHFLFSITNTAKVDKFKKEISLTDFVEKDLNSKINALHRITDFYNKSGLPITGTQYVYFKSTYSLQQLTLQLLNYQLTPPESLATKNITDLHNPVTRMIYKQSIPTGRDVILRFTGTKVNFSHQESINAFHDILFDNDQGEVYVSKDAISLPSSLINEIFKRKSKNYPNKFDSYTSQIMDPASENKDIFIPDHDKNPKIKVLFCVLTNGNRIFLNATKSIDTDGKHKISFLFDLCDLNGTTIIIGTDPIEIYESPLPPSISDVVIKLLDIENKPLKKAGKQLVNLFKTKVLQQNQRQTDLDTHYFNPFINAIDKLFTTTTMQMSDDDKKLILIALKTIGDQSYIWDSLIYDKLKPSKTSYKEGSFVCTGDSFLLNNIVWGKISNAIFASKSNSGIIRNPLIGSTYQILIYLKPTKLLDAEIKVAQAKAAAEALEVTKALEAERTKKIVECNKFYLGIVESTPDESMVVVESTPDEIESTPGYKSMDVDVGVGESKSGDSMDVGESTPGYKSMDVDVNKKLKSLNTNKQTIIQYLIDFFNGIMVPETRTGTYYRYSEGDRELIPQETIGNHFYSACYLLQFIFQTEIALIQNKVLLKEIKDKHDANTIPDFGTVDIYTLQSYYDDMNKINNNISSAETFITGTLEKIIHKDDLTEESHITETQEKKLKDDLTEESHITETQEKKPKDASIRESLITYFNENSPTEIYTQPDFESLEKSLIANANEMSNKIELLLQQGYPINPNTRFPIPIPVRSKFRMMKDKSEQFFEDHMFSILNHLTFPGGGGDGKKREREKDPYNGYTTTEPDEESESESEDEDDMDMEQQLSEIQEGFYSVIEYIQKLRIPTFFPSNLLNNKINSAIFYNINAILEIIEYLYSINDYNSYIFYNAIDNFILKNRESHTFLKFLTKAGFIDFSPWIDQKKKKRQKGGRKTIKKKRTKNTKKHNKKKNNTKQIRKNKTRKSRK
jgi:hypothetical protein